MHAHQCNDEKSSSEENLLTSEAKPQGYNLFTNNCEHLAMLATVGQKMSIQVSTEMYDELSQHSARIATQSYDTVARNASSGTVKAVGKVAGGVISRTIARTAVKGGVTGGTAEVSETSVASALSSAFRVGYPAAISGVSVGVVAGAALVANTSIEAPLLTREIYKAHRKKKFGVISNNDFKREVTRETFTRVNTVLGGVGGAIAGQVIIPVPILGAVVGRTIGTLAGKAAGYGEGILASKLIKDKPVDLPVIVCNKYSKLDSIL